MMISMKVTVFGASGNVGNLVVKRLLADDHEVIAFVHGASQFEESAQLHIVKGDIHEASDVAKALVDSEAVISTLGSWGTKQKDILSAAMRVIVPQMESLGIKRIVSLTGAAAIYPGEQTRTIDKLNRLILGFIAPKILRDGENHIKTLFDSSLDWTVVRSPIMKNYGSANYQLQQKPISPIAVINRQAVANSLVDLINQDNYFQSAVYIIKE